MRVECESTAAAAEEGGHGGGAVVVVGVKLDSRSKELLTWALVKVAHSGDRVIALHVLDPAADKSSLLSLVKTFDSVLAAYEGLCNLKQIDLKLEVRRGSPVQKILFAEAKSCGCTSLIIGTSEVHKIRSRISVAKYCAKNLHNNVSVICVDNGKIVFQRKSTSIIPECGNTESRFKRRKILPKSPLGLPPPTVLPSSVNVNESNSMALVPIKTKEMHEPKWSLISKMFLHGQRASYTPSTKKSSVMQWILKLQDRQSVASIYPDQKQFGASDSHIDVNQEKGAVAPHLAETNSVGYSSKIMSEELKGLLEKYSSICQFFSYQELLLATNNFVSDNLIGKGGSSRVYRGTLPGGDKLAVKVINPSEELLRQFISEIEIITSLHHKNLISLVGFCFEEDQLLLVYNLLSRGSLEDNLHGARKLGNSFTWEQRYKVALGVAEALDHLHNAAEPIIHRDVKSSNILLSDDFEPQLSDFGLATWASSSSHHIDTSDVAGTFGYLAPEYFIHGKVNQKIDVYAFGVVLLELLSGRKPIDDGPKGQESLVMWAEHVLKEGDFSKLLDPDLINACEYQDQFEKMVFAATLCIRHAPQSRPDITLVFKLLQGDSEVTEWARNETSTLRDNTTIDDKQSVANIQSFINLALNDVEDDSASISSTEPNISVEDYLKGRWSRSSSFD